jgi:hypothetical protein
MCDRRQRYGRSGALADGLQGHSTGLRHRSKTIVYVIRPLSDPVSTHVTKPHAVCHFRYWESA